MACNSCLKNGSLAICSLLDGWSVVTAAFKKRIIDSGCLYVVLENEFKDTIRLSSFRNPIYFNSTINMKIKLKALVFAIFIFSIFTSTAWSATNSKHVVISKQTPHIKIAKIWFSRPEDDPEFDNVDNIAIGAQTKGFFNVDAIVSYYYDLDRGETVFKIDLSAKDSLKLPRLAYKPPGFYTEIWAVNEKEVLKQLFTKEEIKRVKRKSNKKISKKVYLQLSQISFDNSCDGQPYSVKMQILKK